MTKCVAIPYFNKVERYEITNKLRKEGQRYSVMDGFIYVEIYTYVEREMSVAKQCWEEKHKLQRNFVSK